jgi:uncharacterized protein YbjT (DUF2867 family)
MRRARVDAGDIAAAPLSPAEHQGRAYTITGPTALTVQQVADELSAGIGSTVRAEDPPTERVVYGSTGGPRTS